MPASTIFLQSSNFIDACYIVAFSLFIYGLSGLTGPRTAVRGNPIAATGMAIAVVATLLTPHVWSGSSTPWLIILGLLIGTAIGIPAARNVRMTAMPQMVALFNGVGGGAVAIIAWVEYRHHFGGHFALKSEIPTLFAAIIGSISFWGSNIAFGKLQALIPSRPIKLPGQAIINGTLFVIAVASAIVLAAGTHSQALFILGILVTAALLGNMVVLPIGGADMPVVISLLNAFTGLSAAATGVALNNTALIVGGMLVGASGTILTNLMAKAMNRSVPAIVAGGFGGEVAAPTAGAGADGDRGPVKSTTPDDVAIQLSYARQVVIAPGYGMAVAQAQYAVRDLEKALESKGVRVLFAIHPVAGRMPGHMNVLLAESQVPYDLLKEMDEVNPEFARTDVTLVIGANDVTNPAAKNEPGSPIYGMPILDVSQSKSVIVLKRSMASGFAGIDNPLFYEPETSMLFGDAKQSVGEITSAIEDL